MRKLLLIVTLAASFVAVASLPAGATGTIPWTGNGADNLPCEEGAHWVLAPSFGIESATLVVDGQSYEMVQHGNGSWSADSVGSIPEDVDFESFAWVEYTGEGDERNHLQLSHCTDDGTTPSPSPSPTDTETPSPSVGGGGTGKCEGHGQDRPKCQTATKTAPAPLAFTGPRTGEIVFWSVAMFALALTGLYLLRRSARER